MKRFFCALLMICMLVSLLSVAALAADESAEGASAEPTGEMEEEASAEMESSFEPSDEPDVDAAVFSLNGTESEQTYYLSVSAQNGSVSVTVDDKTFGYDGQVSAGAKVVIKVTGDDGYGRMSASLGYSAEDGHDYTYYFLDAVEEPAGTFTFTMPEGTTSAYFSFYPDDYVKRTYHLTQDGSEITWSYYGTKDTATVVTNETPLEVKLPEGKKVTAWALGSPTGEKLKTGYYAFTEDVDLYAVVEDGVKLTFHYADGDSHYYYVEKNQNVMLESTDFMGESNGQYAIGWSVNPDGSGTIYRGQYEGEPCYRFSEDTDFYAVYTDPVTVSLYDGTDLMNSETLGDGGVYTLPYYNDTGDRVLYWAVGSANSETRYQAGERVIIDGDTDLYAILAEGEITLLYYVDGNLTASGERPKNTEVALMDELLGPGVPSGMALLGWSLEPDGDVIGQKASFSEDTNLYAVFAPAVVVAYDANGGECSALYNGRYSRAVGSYLTNYTAADNFVSREGYTLTGWSATQDGSEPFDFTKPITGHTTLYAVWEENTNKKTDDSTDVTVEVPEDDKDKIAGLVFVATPLPEDDETVVVTVIGKKLSGTVEKSFVLDIYFADAVTGDEVEVSGRRTVTIPIPEGWDAKKTVVLYVDPESERVVNMNGVVSADGKTISFVTDHFSYYALVQVSNTSANGDTSSAPSGKGHSPKTGDEAMPMLWAALAAVSVMGVAVVARKKKN